MPSRPAPDPVPAEDRDTTRGRGDAVTHERSAASARPGALRHLLAVQLAVGPVLAAHVAAWGRAPVSPSLRGIAADWLLATALGCVLLCWQHRSVPALGVLAGGLGLLFALTHAKVHLLRDWPRWSDLSLLPEAFAAMPGPTALTVLLAAVGVATLAANLRRPGRPGRIGGALLLATLGLPLALPETTRGLIDGVFTWFPWYGNDPASRGIALALARDAAETLLERRALRGRAALSRPPPRPADPERRRNLHVVLAESLTDPRDLGPGFPRAAIDPRLAGWVGGRALAPRYGGGSAQSEFELLCGLPATAALPDPVIFNGLEGGPAPCLPRRLAGLGYATRASVAVEPWFFNARRAYASLGFEEVRFAPDLPRTARRDAADATGALLRHNRRWLEERLGRVPIFDYVATVEPHFPFDGASLDPPLPAGSPRGTGLATGLRDATRAIADHVAWLAERDPDAVILVVGDHQAPGFAAPGDGPEAQLRRLRVPAALLDAGTPQPLGLVSHFDLTERLEAAVLGGRAMRRDWRRPLPRGRLLFATASGVGACPGAGPDPCRALRAWAAGLESRTLRLVATARRR